MVIASGLASYVGAAIIIAALGPALGWMAVLFCGAMGLMGGGPAVIDGSKFKAVNNRDRNFTQAKIARSSARGTPGRD